MVVVREKNEPNRRKTRVTSVPVVAKEWVAGRCG